MIQTEHKLEFTKKFEIIYTTKKIYCLLKNSVKNIVIYLYFNK